MLAYHPNRNAVKLTVPVVGTSGRALPRRFPTGPSAASLAGAQPTLPASRRPVMSQRWRRWPAALADAHRTRADTQGAATPVLLGAARAPLGSAASLAAVRKVGPSDSVQPAWWLQAGAMWLHTALHPSARHRTASRRVESAAVRFGEAASLLLEPTSDPAQGTGPLTATAAPPSAPETLVALRVCSAVNPHAHTHLPASVM